MRRKEEKVERRENKTVEERRVRRILKKRKT
jgi:hypothetical protein